MGNQTVAPAVSGAGRGAGAGAARPGQRPAASLEPLRPEVLVVQVLSHLLQILHVSAARQETGLGHPPATPGHAHSTHQGRDPGRLPQETAARGQSDSHGGKRRPNRSTLLRRDLHSWLRKLNLYTTGRRHCHRGENHQGVRA